MGVSTLSSWISSSFSDFEPSSDEETWVEVDLEGWVRRGVWDVDGLIGGTSKMGDKIWQAVSRSRERVGRCVVGCV